jgi:signal transduction histidine kinase
VPRLPSRASPVDAVLGVLFGWLGWLSAHLVWQRPDVGPRGPRGGPRPPQEPDLPVWTDVSWTVFVFLVPVVLGIAVRRRWPRIGFGAVLVGLTGYRAAGADIGPVFLALAFSVFAMASVHPVRRWAPLTLGLLPVAFAGHSSEPAFGLFNPALYGELLAGLAVAVLPAMFALLHRTRRDNERREREQDRHRYADEERLRIAREVHDVVGHSLSVITMQAGVALHLLEKRPPDRQLSESMEAIRRTSKDALTELRTTLEVFRDPDGGAPHGLRPGLARLDELVAALVAAGRDVRVVRVPTEQPPLPTTVDQAAFRIVQEALTNVVRHTGAGLATVVLSRRPDELTIEVTDDGPATRIPEAGNGMLGMGERARAVAGRIELEVVAPHGLRVRATLPVRDAS